MSDGVPPIQPVSRIEPVSRVSGLIDTNVALYQIFASNLTRLFKPLEPASHSTHIPFTPWIPVLYERNLRPSKWKKRIKKENKDSKKTVTLLKDLFDQMT